MSKSSPELRLHRKFPASGPRAGALAAAMAVGVALMPHGASAESARKPVGAVIRDAQAALLEKDRRKASELLLEAIQLSGRTRDQKRQLKLKLQSLSVIFLTDRAQSIAALAETLIGEKPKEALEHFDEALRLEPDNVELLVGAARSALAFDECVRADQSITKGLAIDPFSKDLKVLSLYSKICQGTLRNLEQRLTAKDLELEGAEPLLRPIQARDLFERKEFKRLGAFLSIWANSNRLQDPELNRWQWAHSLALERPDISGAQRYIQACQSLTARRRQELRLNPHLCRDVATVKSELERHQSSRPAETPGGSSS